MEQLTDFFPLELRYELINIQEISCQIYLLIWKEN